MLPYTGAPVSLILLRNGSLLARILMSNFILPLAILNWLSSTYFLITIKREIARTSVSSSLLQVSLHLFFSCNKSTPSIFNFLPLTYPPNYLDLRSNKIGISTILIFLLSSLLFSSPLFFTPIFPLSGCSSSHLSSLHFLFTSSLFFSSPHLSSPHFSPSQGWCLTIMQYGASLHHSPPIQF